MATIFPNLANIQRLKVPPTPGELYLVKYLQDELDSTYEVFFNPYLDGDRPDIIILREHCAAFVIEVKDWNIDSYKVNEHNKWEVYNGSKSSKKASPQSQAFRYKKNLYDLHLPVVGMGRLTNPNFFNLVHCFVYFHNAKKAGIDSLYGPAEEKLRDQQLKFNKSRKDAKISDDAYNNSSDTLDRKKRNLQRDKSMAFGIDSLKALVIKIKKNSKHVLFDEDVYRDFKRRLSPSDHTEKQGIAIRFDKRQLALTESANVRQKVTGVAGGGKTSVLCQRAINAFKRHDSTVLMLTFNITLKNSIRDKVSDIQGNRDFSSLEISNYHQFYNSQVNNMGQDINELIERYGIEKLYSTDVFQDTDVAKYQTILIDETQDYESAWVKIIRDRFLGEGGEMVLFGDQSQNIYARSPVIAQGFDRWKKLNRSYRTSIESPLNQLFKDFQLRFLLAKHSDAEMIDLDPFNLGLGFSLLKCEKIQAVGWKRLVFDSINNYIRAYDLHPNDVVVLSSKISFVRQLNALWAGTEKTHCMFETYEELATCTGMEIGQLQTFDEHGSNLGTKDYKRDIERVRRAKKNHFYANSGLIKLSTLHSYKGLESKTVFYLMGEDDAPEAVYTAITRSSENLIVFDIGSKNECSEFMQDAVK